jgi:hypothetical protein
MHKLTTKTSRALLLAAAAALLAGCQGGTPWGATPREIPLPDIRLPNLEAIPAHVEAGTTAGSQRLAERVRAALAAQPGLSDARLTVDGYEGGVIILGGTLASAADRPLAIQTTRQVLGVRDVVDRMSAP